MNNIQLMSLFVVLVVLRSLLPIKKKNISLIVSFFLALIFVIQLSSVMLTGQIADYRFYENFNINDVLSVADFFGKEGVLLALALALTTFLIHFLGKRVGERIHKKIIPITALLVGGVLMSFNGGILKNAYESFQLKFVEDASFTEALASLEIDEEAYIEKSEIIATKGKNIIVLSLESFEKGYLGEKLKHLTPNLTKLAKEYTLLNMEQSPAGGWTSASMYTAITGVPAFFGTHGNSVFQSSFENKLTTLADVLKNTDYDLQYFIGKKEYSGINDILKIHGFTVKSEKDFETKYESVAWGMHDMDLFHEFKKELLLKKDSDRPFALFLSTIGTHFPNGVPDQRIDNLLPPQKSRLELMASATDHFVGDLIDFLKRENLMEDTVFYIYPDHLLIGQTSRVLEDFDERSLYLLTNADPKKLTRSKDSAIYQIDIPKIILEGAEVQHNAKFLTDYISDKDKNAFLRKKAKNLLQLNDASLTTLNLLGGFLVEKIESMNSFKIKNTDGLVVIQGELPTIGECHRILLDETMKPMENYTIDLTRAGKIIPKTPYLDILRTDGTLYVSLNNDKKNGITKKGIKEISFNQEDLSLLSEITSDIYTGIVLNSNSWHGKKGSTFLINGKMKALTRGLTLLVFNAFSKPEYKTFDTHGSEEATKDFISTLKELDENNSQFIIMAHDSASKELEKKSDTLEDMGYKVLSRLDEREAYIMHNLNGKILELTNDESIYLQLPYPKNLRGYKLYFNETKIEFEPSIDRYIAHAGGQIDGIKYTNSKEALDYNYSRGFRMFELDIIETSDKKFVAAHDWNHWAKETRYKGPLPPTRSEFIKHKIRGTYTTLDMEGINQWFKEHHDAILVTDKVNEPERFAEDFVDKWRLLMELFSIEAIENAVANSISPIPSEKALAEIKGDPISFLKGKGIYQIAMSRRGITAKLDFLKECRANNIQVYVYHVNFDSEKDERYVKNNEIGIVYGMYADKWLPSFLSGYGPLEK